MLMGPDLARRRVVEKKEAGARERFDVAVELKLAETTEETVAGTIEGYASVFNLLDRGGDIVVPGAFKKSLADWRKKKQLPPMLWSHNPDEPIGVWTEISEDEKGLKVTGELILEVQQAKEAHALLKRKALSGLSIGFRTLEDEYDRQTGARHLKRIELWEISLCTIPMLPEAQISGVKAASAAELIKRFNPREMEDALRDAGLSRADAPKAISIFRDWLQRDAGEPGDPLREEARDVLMSLRKAVAVLRP